MVHREPPLHHHRVLVAIAQEITQVPPDTQEDDIGLVRTPLKGGKRGSWTRWVGRATVSIFATSTRLPLVFATQPCRRDRS
jgi:hypothetical protein